jgi:hypothetical protein
MAQERFWETKPPAQWTRDQLDYLMNESPWARSAEASQRMGLTASPVRTFLASAPAMRLAEEELLRRTIRRPDALRAAREARGEFLDHLEQNQGKIIVLAIPYEPNALADAQEARKMETESFLKAGKKKLKLAGHFPPSPADPVLRLIFLRDIDPKAKALEFELYLPSVPSPWRQVYFKLADFPVKDGRPEL